jgi:heme/copper-type cytochrome/quinol oxidase subunit 1
LTDPAGRPDGALFNRLGILHGLASTVFCVLPMMFAGLGYAFAPAALGRQRTALRPLGWVALLALVVGFCFLIAVIFFGSGTPQVTGTGWILYAPLSQVAYQGATSLWLANIGVGLGLMSLALVSIDFIACIFVGQHDAEKRAGFSAWAFALCGFVFLIGAFATLIVGASVRVASLAVADNDPLNIFILLVSLAVVVSAVSLGFQRGGNFLIVPLLLALVYFSFVFYGASIGVVLSQAGADRMLHGTYYVVAYSHFMFQSASLFAFFAGMNAVFPSIGRQLWLGIVQGTLMVVGLIMTFLPQMFLGLQGMPRRYMDYSDAFLKWNYVSSVGTLVTLLAVGLWIVILLRAWLGSGRAA